MTAPASPTRGAATPGPWRIDGKGRYALVCGADSTIVAACDQLPFDGHEANMRLAAAAPDLRDALAGLLALCESSLSPDSDAVRGPLTAARLALQKAEANRGL